jgi:hypothetical protein
LPQYAQVKITGLAESGRVRSAHPTLRKKNAKDGAPVDCDGDRVQKRYQLAGDNFDFEDSGPLLSGYEETVALGIVGNAV